jgi:prefoldin alpha subunit
MANNEEHEQSKQQQMVMQFQMFEQQIRMIQEQQQAVDQAIVDLASLNLQLDDLIGKKDNDIIAPIGRGIYASAKLTSEELLVDIGNKNFVKKSIPETKNILQMQLKKLEKVKEELNGELEKINNELTKVFMESQKGNKHSHGVGCHCEEECECEDGECACEGGCSCETSKSEEE